MPAADAWADAYGPVSARPRRAARRRRRRAWRAISQRISRHHRFAPEITGSAAARTPASPWSWEGGTAIIVAQGETIDVIAQRHGVPAVRARRGQQPADRRCRFGPGQRLVIPRYTVRTCCCTAPIASNAAPRRLPRPLRNRAGAACGRTGSSGLHVVAPATRCTKISRTMAARLLMSPRPTTSSRPRR